MRVGGIVAEFNPFHSGHQALCQETRREGVTHLVAVMSGNFVQRGDFAIAEKRLRAACALQDGVDLVVELPTPWATATAQVFARGAVSLLQACGCVNVLCFGSESGDGEALRILARAIDEQPVRQELQTLLAAGHSFAHARELAVQAVYGDSLSELLGRGNDVLGVEYLRAAAQLNWEPALFLLRRRGVAHDAQSPARQYASASYLRGNAECFSLLVKYMSGSTLKLLRQAREDGRYPANGERLDRAVLARLRTLDQAELGALPDLSEGLENRLYTAIRGAGSVQELLRGVKTKRYPLARVRRLILSAFLGLTREDCAGNPPYLRVLGFNQRGREVLARMKQTATLPVGTSLLRLSHHSPQAAGLCKLEERTTDLFALALPKPLPCGFEHSASAVFSKDSGHDL